MDISIEDMDLYIENLYSLKLPINRFEMEDSGNQEKISPGKITFIKETGQYILCNSVEVDPKTSNPIKVFCSLPFNQLKKSSD